MNIEVKEYTYDTMPEYSDIVEGAGELLADPDEISLSYIPDVVYDEKKQLHLQIIKAGKADKECVFPCIVFIQGSAWKKQNTYENVANLSRLAKRGYTIAIAEYRHSEIAHFPAQIIDGKNAIRFMKEHWKDYNADPDKVIIMGDSSGGHTSALAGMTSETDLYDEPANNENCRVRGIIDLYGAVEVTLPDGFPSTLNHQLPDSPEGLLMGYNIRENMEEAACANAKSYAEFEYPPMLILHGTKDKTVFCQESVNLYKAVNEAGREVKLVLVKKADHGGPAFWSDAALNIYDDFIQKCLQEEEI